MKAFKGLTLILALTLIIAPLIVARPAFANPDSHYTVQPVAISPLTNLNSSPYGLEVPATPSPINDNFTVEIHLTGATGVSGVEVHLYFGNILSYAIPVSYIDMLGTTGGVLTGPQGKLLYGVSAGFYDASGNGPLDPPYTGAVYYKVAAASTGAAQDVLDALIAKITFTIQAQPTTDIGNLALPLVLDFTDIVSTSTKGAETQGMLTLDAVAFTYPTRANIFVQPSAYTGKALGDMFLIDVDITAAAFWDVAGFDITFTYDSTLLALVSLNQGTFLGSNQFGFNESTSPGTVQAVFTKLDDPTPSSGTGTLMQMTFNATTLVTGSITSTFGLVNTYLASWAHPERKMGPWFNGISAVDLPFDNGPSPPALAWSHTTTNGTYTAPTSGAQLDLYDQYPAPYGGQGTNVHSDAFGPQSNVTLYGKVTYNGEPVVNKLVVFEVHKADGSQLTILQGFTDSNGNAIVSFRIPMTNITNDPSIFGWWFANATSDELDANGKPLTDTMYFQVGWLVTAQIIPLATAYSLPQYTTYPNTMQFNVTISTISEQTRKGVLSVDAYDAADYPIGEFTVNFTINAIPVANNAIYPYGNTTAGTLTEPASIPVPSWARVGAATAFAYVLTDFPVNGGTAYGPPGFTATGAFSIKGKSP